MTEAIATPKLVVEGVDQTEEEEGVLPEECISTTSMRKSLFLRPILVHLIAAGVEEGPSKEDSPSHANHLSNLTLSPSTGLIFKSVSEEDDTIYGKTVEDEDAEPPDTIPQDLRKRIYVDDEDEDTFPAHLPSPTPCSLPPPQLTRRPIFPLWTRYTEEGLHKIIRNMVTCVATHAAWYPWTYIFGTAFFSFFIAAIGLMTNFVLVFDHDSMFTPMNSPPAKHGKWVLEESGFVSTADMLLVIHGNGENILRRHAVAKVFEALDTLRAIPGYRQVCNDSTYRDPFTDQRDCWIWSVTEFWHHNRTLFEQHQPTDLELMLAFSQPVFPDGIPIFDEIIFGALERTNTFTKPDIVNLLTTNINGTQGQTISEAMKAVNDWYAENGLVTSMDKDYVSRVPAFIVSVGFPNTEATEEFQERALWRLQALQEQWRQEGTPDSQHPQQPIQLDFFCTSAYNLEYQRALVRDMPLVVVVFAVMLGFTTCVLHQYGRHKGNASDPLWKSRGSLGVASMITIGMSLMSGFGMLFCWGVPFTNITLIAPFIILGVGLDDTFVIMGAYFRLLRLAHAEQDEERQRKKNEIHLRSINLQDETPKTGEMERERQQKEVVERIRATLQEVGLSISMTTMTTILAFILGCTSSVPGIRWLCLYASVTIGFDFFYQVSFFIALLVLDERRIAGTLLVNQERGEYPGCIQCLINHFCCCFCWSCCCFGLQKTTPHRLERISQAHLGASAIDQSEEELNLEEEEFFMDRMMRWYGKQLLRPVVKVIVILIFVVTLGLNIYWTTKLEQRFNVEDYVPSDSYMRPFLRSMEEHSNLVVPMGMYFRHVDQSEDEIQTQMIDFVEDIASLPQVGRMPEFCWVRDMHLLFTGGDEMEVKLAKFDLFQALGPARKEKLTFMLEFLLKGNLTFEEKLNAALTVPGLRDIYGQDIVRDEDGRITASRCFIFIRHLDMNDIHDQIDMLQVTNEVTSKQPINQLPGSKGDLPFFVYDNLFAFWQLYTVAVYELVLNTIMGVIAVCIVGLVIIPNWTALLFVGPLIVVVYFYLIGTMQACGLYINAVTYVTVVISIGLMVDFLMHILLRYYETKGNTRDQKVRETLETMGASMLLGGFTTWLGVLPLVFSTTKIFWTVFIAFFAMVSWGLLVGLVLLPVLLSYCGPLNTTITTSAEEPTCQVSFGKMNPPPSRESVTESETTHRLASPGVSKSSESSNLTTMNPSKNHLGWLQEEEWIPLETADLEKKSCILPVSVQSLATGRTDPYQHPHLKSRDVLDNC